MNEFDRRQFLGLGLGVFGSSLISSKVIAKHQSLQNKVDSLVKNYREKYPMRRERTSWSVYDLNSNELLVSINRDISRSSASMFKPYVALACNIRERERKFSWDEENLNKLQLMLEHSKNSQTNDLMKSLGGPSEVEIILKSNYSKIFEGLSLTEYIPRGGRTYRNESSAKDYSKFLYALHNNHFPNSSLIEEHMRESKTRFYAPNCEVINKTGTTAKVCGDMGVILPNKGRGYIMVGIIERDRPIRGYYNKWARRRKQILADVSKLVLQDLT